VIGVEVDEARLNILVTADINPRPNNNHIIKY
jgi:hypothetical protein